MNTKKEFMDFVENMNPAEQVRVHLKSLEEIKAPLDVILYFFMRHTLMMGEIQYLNDEQKEVYTFFKKTFITGGPLIDVLFKIVNSNKIEEKKLKALIKLYKD